MLKIKQKRRREVMPIEGEVGELNSGRIRRGCRRTDKKSMVWMVAPRGKGSKLIERRAT